MTLEQEDELAESVPCPMCPAPAGRPCVNAFAPDRPRAFPHSTRLIAAATKRDETTKREGTS